MLVRDTIAKTAIHRAAGRDFDRLVAWYGFPRPYSTPRWAWRRACIAAVFGRRCTPETLQLFLEGALAPYAKRLTVAWDDTPNRLTITQGSLALSDAGRWVRVPGLGLLRISLVHSATTASVSTHTPWPDTPGEAPSELLAFSTQDTPHRVNVLVRAQSYPATPPTYFREEGEPRPAGEPNGGIMLEDASETAQDTGAPVAYLDGDGILQDIEELATKMLVPAGTFVVLRRA